MGAIKLPVHNILRTIRRLNDFNELPFRDDPLQFADQFINMSEVVPAVCEYVRLVSSHRMVGRQQILIELSPIYDCVLCVGYRLIHHVLLRRRAALLSPDGSTFAWRLHKHSLKDGARGSDYRALRSLVCMLIIVTAEETR